MEINNNYNINFGAKFGPNLKKQLTRREGNNNPIYAEFVEDSFNKTHNNYLLDGLTIEHINNTTLKISHEYWPEQYSFIRVDAPRGSKLSQRVLNIPAITYIYAQDKIIDKNIATSIESIHQIEQILLSELMQIKSNMTPSKAENKTDFYKALRDDITRITNNTDSICEEIKEKEEYINEQIRIAKRQCK
jgi:hypothetical protein